MNTKMITAGALSGLIVAGGVVSTVSAQSAATQTGLSIEQVIEIALTEVPGEILEVERDREDGMLLYEVEVLAQDGTEMELEINAETGEILEVAADGDKDCDRDRDDDDDEDQA